MVNEGLTKAGEKIKSSDSKPGFKKENDFLKKLYSSAAGVAEKIDKMFENLSTLSEIYNATFRENFTYSQKGAQ